MENENLSTHARYAEIRDEGQRLFVALTRTNRESRDELQVVYQGAGRLALASVEALELLADTVSGLREAINADVRQALDAALAGASERLLRLRSSWTERSETQSTPRDIASSRARPLRDAFPTA